MGVDVLLLGNYYTSGNLHEFEFEFVQILKGSGATSSGALLLRPIRQKKMGQKDLPSG